MARVFTVRLFLLSEADDEPESSRFDELCGQLADAADDNGFSAMGADVTVLDDPEAQALDLENACPLCKGSGRKEPEEEVESLSEEEWEGLYGKECSRSSEELERPSPKGQVEGSNPSGSAINEDEESDSEAQASENEASLAPSEERQE